LRRRRTLVVVTERGDAEGLPDALVTTAQGYIEGGDAALEPHTLIVNLCRSLAYGSDGYYVSLLADARAQQVLPRLETTAGVADPYSSFRALQEAGIPTVDAAELAIRRRSLPDDDASDAYGQSAAGGAALLRQGDELRLPSDGELEDIIICFGVTTDARFAGVAAGIYRVWPAPLLRARLLLEEEQWKVIGLEHASPLLLQPDERRLLVARLTGDARALRRGTSNGPRGTVRASIAVLLDPLDPFSASSPETIERLERVAAGMNVHVARITASDLRRLPEYDALFIRSLTGVKLPAFQFALRAEALDMPVIDDPQSIIRCGNKVYLEELLRREDVPLPRARIVTAHSPWSHVEELGVPFVMKSPDGSFSAGVHKIASRDDYDVRSRELLEHSPLLIAQEWLPTEYDWRVTILDGRVLFAARYFMAHGHWQIRAEEGGVERYGKVEAVPRSGAPPAVLDIALRAARLIGRGLYGVDLKETAAGPVVIEVNDNPNLDAGYEDKADGDVIYREIVDCFLRRIEEESEAGRRNGVRAVAKMTTQRAATEPARAASEASAASGASGAATAGAAAKAAAAAPADSGAPADAAASPLRRRATGVVASRREASRRRTTPASYEMFSVAGLELEYPTVDENLDVRALVEPAFRTIAGRGTSDIELDRVGFSNEIADHVFEVKTLEPVRSLREAEEDIVAGIRRFADVLAREWRARLLPTAMHPWFDPRHGRLWTRSGLRIYTTYAHIFDIRTHGWMNVHATHLNLPFGDERQTMAMHTAAALLLPYLPALAASSPVHDGRLQPHADARLAWIMQHQASIPETCGRVVPELASSFAGYRREILRPMYAALDRFPHSEAIRHEFLNSRGAVLRFARRALELRVLDTQECVHMDIAIAAFTRAALRLLTADVLAGRVVVPPHDLLVMDFEACVRDGMAATVAAPHLPPAAGTAGAAPVREVLTGLLHRARGAVPPEEAGYLQLVSGIIADGSLSERIRARLAPHASSPDRFAAELRRVYGELADCLIRNEPWTGRAADP
jgi:glutathione synthase/RimK-type ligase-like ATP-grasp enzyme/gamma-glutamyl:cysteine ligase YbdK (ATP-grasp superfamily)